MTSKIPKMNGEIKVIIITAIIEDYRLRKEG